MYHIAWTGSAWIGWEALGGYILEQPRCISTGIGSIALRAGVTDNLCPTLERGVSSVVFIRMPVWVWQRHFPPPPCRIVR
jgi:hypothetical protein